MLFCRKIPWTLSVAPKPHLYNIILTLVARALIKYDTLLTPLLRPPMPPAGATPLRLSATSLCISQCTQQTLLSRNITDSVGLSSQAKIGLICAGAVVFVLLLATLAWFLLRCRSISTFSAPPRGTLPPNFEEPEVNYNEPQLLTGFPNGVSSVYPRSAQDRYSYRPSNGIVPPGMSVI